jgi:hypothetical protein
VRTALQYFALALASATLAAVGLSNSSVAAAPEEADAVGVVADYGPTGAQFTFVRPPRDETVPVRIGTVVVAGDRVSLKPGFSITVQLADGEVSRLEGPGTFVVRAGSSLGKLAAIFRSLPRLFDDAAALSGTAASREMQTCGDPGHAPKPIDVPIVRSGARIIAGTRGLSLAWRGGCPPFTVRVSSGATRVAQVDSIDDWQVRMENLELGAGWHTLLVTDATGKHWQEDIEVVTEGPVVPANLAAEISGLGLTAQAIWIAQLDGGRWRLETIERLRPLVRANDPLAMYISESLLWGVPLR